MQRNSILGVLFATGLLFGPALTTPSAAQTGNEVKQSYGYLGGGIGYYRLEDDEFPENFEDERESWRLFAGGMVNPVFGVEAGYTDLAEASDSGFESDVDGITLAALGQVPLGNVLSIYGKGGLFSWDVERRGPLGFSGSDDGRDFFYGFGARIGVSTPLGLRLEYERFELDDTDIDLATVNLEFRF